jgi:hypothetical protein
MVTPQIRDNVNSKINDGQEKVSEDIIVIHSKKLPQPSPAEAKKNY